MRAGSVWLDPRRPCAQGSTRRHILSAAGVGATPATKRDRIHDMPREAPRSGRPARTARERAERRAEAREQARAAHRLRIAIAMVEAIGENGYHATRVSDVTD